jgi:hypothetical protein
MQKQQASDESDLTKKSENERDNKWENLDQLNNDPYA